MSIYCRNYFFKADLRQATKCVRGSFPEIMRKSRLKFIGLAPTPVGPHRSRPNSACSCAHTWWKKQKGISCSLVDLLSDSLAETT